MTNHDGLIAALRIPMDVTLRNGAPELDEYDEQREAAADRIEELEADRDNLSDKLELERALTDGAHRRAGEAEAKLAKAVEALKEIAAWDEYFHGDVEAWKPTEEALIARAALTEINGGEYD